MLGEMVNDRELTHGQAMRVAKRMASWFKRDNPRFDRERFVNAVEDAMDEIVYDENDDDDDGDED